MFEDSRLVPGNIFDQWTELLNVIHPNCRNSRDDRLLNNIRSVILSTIMSLIDGNIDSLSDKGVDRYE